MAGWNDQICVATDRFLVFFDNEDSCYESARFKHDVDTALPPEISHVVTIAAGSKYDSLYILSDWIWTLSTRNKLNRWIEARSVSSISASEGGKVLLAGNTTLTMYAKEGAMLQKFILPHEYEHMKICQAEITGAKNIVVSICGQGKNTVLLMNEEGIVKYINDSSTHDIQSMDSKCEIPHQFIASGKGDRVFVAETYSSGYKSWCGICTEKIVTLTEDLQLNQIILPDTRPHFKHYSRICYSGDQLIVICNKISHRDDADSEGRNEVLTPVVNVYRVENESDSETDDEGEDDDESETEN